MRAIRFHTHGGPDVLQYEEAPDTVNCPGHVLIRVAACALNHLDLWQRRGLDRVTLPMPHISGADVSGTIAELGEGVPDLELGQRVMLQPGLSCGRCAACLSGQDQQCARYDVLGYQSEGGYAELVSVPAANVVPIPDHVDFVTAAAFPLTFLTAWHMLFEGGHLTGNDTVLVVAAGSGVGQAAVQLAKSLGARVIATARGDDKCARASALGADDVIDSSREDVSSRVKALTSRRGVDVVIEHVGVATWESSVRSLARGGRIVTCGATTGYEATLDLRQLFARQLTFVGSYMGAKAELLKAAEGLFRGRYAPVVDMTFPLAAAADAHRRLESGQQFGKIVLTM
ncbi:MAG: zinc-binding dehydrogenase [Acidobacteria bacterium]|nr:zinc-binding dehydrogenase [Acidobacteriota bacterium]